MENPKVSIIVAVYNTERYLHRCVNSLLAQTYQHIEVILIDDGSTDNSPSICDDFARKDNRIKAIHKPNGGVSTARQTGIEAASGDYIIHADADDYVDAQMVEELLAEALRTGADIVTCDFFVNTELKIQNYKGSTDLLKRIIDVDCVCVCWNSLVRRKFISNHDISFTPNWLSMSEDFLFLIRLLVAGAKATHLHKAFYHYLTNRKQSLTHKHSLKKLESIQAVISEIAKLVDIKEYDGLYKRKKLAFMYAYQGRMFNMLPKLYPEIHCRLKEEGRRSRSFGLSWQLAHALNHPRSVYYISLLRNYIYRHLPHNWHK